MRQNFERCASSNANIRKAEGGKINRFDHFDDEGGDGVANVDVIFERGELFSKDLADVGYLSTGSTVGKVRRNTRIERDDERRGR